MSRYTFINYTGGKYQMLDTIYQMLPADYTTWIEVFCGSAVITLNKTPSRVEIINDLNSEIFNLFNVVKHKHKEFLEQFTYVLNSREFYYKLRKNCMKDLSDVEKAFKTFYIIRSTFGSRLNRPSFARWTTLRKKGVDFDNIEQLVNKTYDRLKGVLIENDDYSEILTKYDAKDVFFFLDPPYLTEDNKRCRDYVYTMSQHDYVVLNSYLTKLKGRFLMTTNDCQFLRKLFKEFNQTVKYIKYSITNKEIRDNPKCVSKKTGQLIVANYDFENQSLYRKGFFKQEVA